MLDKKTIILYHKYRRAAALRGGIPLAAAVVELADTRDLKSLSGNRIRVQAPSAA